MTIGNLFLISVLIYGAALMSVFIFVDIFERKRNNSKKGKIKND